MNIWIVFLPGSGGSFLETVIRSTTDLPVLVPELDRPLLHTLIPDVSGNLTAHAYPRQWHAPTYEEMITTGRPIGPTDTTVYSIITPTSDANFSKIMPWIADNSQLSDSHIYLGPKDPIFGIVSQQKIKNVAKSFMPNERVADWDSTAKVFTDLKRWQQREYLSGYIDYFFDMVDNQKQTAQEKGWMVVDSEDMFNDTNATCRRIFKYLDANVIDELAFEMICKRWQTNQQQVHSGYMQITNYIKAIENDDLDVALPLQSLLYESIIQRYLRVEKNILLKCFDLNAFPRSVKELKEYYE